MFAHAEDKTSTNPFDDDKNEETLKDFMTGVPAVHIIESILSHPMYDKDTQQISTAAQYNPFDDIADLSATVEPSEETISVADNSLPESLPSLPLPDQDLPQGIQHDSEDSSKPVVDQLQRKSSLAKNIKAFLDQSQKK